MTPAAEYTSDEAALLAAILESPADDGPRLIYADWLEENGQPERAEFIRVQCELAGPWKAADYHHALRRREQKSLEWFAAEDLAVDFGLPPHETLYPIESGLSCPRLGVELVVRRGFVAAVSLPTAAFVGGPCGHCVNWAQEARVGEPLAGHPNCPVCHGKPDAPGLAAELARRHPIERVVLTDREPEHVSREPGFDSWQWPGEFGPKGWFPTEEAAVAAMNEWAVAYARAAGKESAGG